LALLRRRDHAELSVHAAALPVLGPHDAALLVDDVPHDGMRLAWVLPLDASDGLFEEDGVLAAGDEEELIEDGNIQALFGDVDGKEHLHIACPGPLDDLLAQALRLAAVNHADPAGALRSDPSEPFSKHGCEELAVVDAAGKHQSVPTGRDAGDGVDDQAVAILVGKELVEDLDVGHDGLLWLFPNLPVLVCIEDLSVARLEFLKGPP